MPVESTVRDRNDPDFDLIETLRWERGAGFIRGELHLARLRASADALGFEWQSRAVENALSNAVARGVSDMMRVRLTLDREGNAACITAAFTALAPSNVWRVAIAKTRLDSSDPLLRHKTSRRAIYETARAEYASDVADEVLLLNEWGELCEGTITNLFLDMGGDALLTPALSCGLLPGILRGELIAQGEAHEATLGHAELANARAVYMGNSLRGLISAQLI